MEFIKKAQHFGKGSQMPDDIRKAFTRTESAKKKSSTQCGRACRPQELHFRCLFGLTVNL
jgi:hypothetical protein